MIVWRKQHCIGAIDRTRARVVQCAMKASILKAKGILMQNVLSAYDFNLYFTLMLPRTTWNMHNSHILANEIHNFDFIFSIPILGKYYLVDYGFAHRSRYVASYKYPDIWISFSGVHNEHTRWRRRLRQRVWNIQILSLIM